MKKLNKDPWLDIKSRYAKDTKLTGKVTNITDYGCFVEIEDGVEGLVHMSEMDWTNKNVRPGKMVQVGNEVEVIVLDIDGDRRRISLGMKQCVNNPWSNFSEKYEVGMHVKSAIKSITDFGIFIGLEGGIDGLIHSSDISWDKEGEEAIRDYTKGDEIEAVILAIDPERERVSLGIKQLQRDPFGEYLEKNPKGTIVKGKVIRVEETQALVELAEEVQARLKAADIAKEKILDVREIFKVGDEIEAKVAGVNSKDGVVDLSIKALGDDDNNSKSAKKAEQVVNPTLGDLIKEQIANNSEEKKDRGSRIED